MSIKQAVQADFIFSCLPTSQDVEALIAAHPPKQGAIWIDCTSGVPESAQKLAKLLEQQGSFIWMHRFLVKPLAQKKAL